MHRHLLGIERLSREDINHVLDLVDGCVKLERQAEKQRSLLRGRTIINCFYDSSTRIRISFEVAGKRLGGDVINMPVSLRRKVDGRSVSKKPFISGCCARVISDCSGGAIVL